jgi:hypothetical protein
VFKIPEETADFIDTTEGFETGSVGSRTGKGKRRKEKVRVEYCQLTFTFVSDLLPYTLIKK